MDEKKRILFIVEAMGGGVFTYITELANQLVNDYEMYVAYATRPQTPEDYKRYFNPKIHLIEVKNFVRSINLRKDIAAAMEIRKIAQRVEPDIIHLHSSKAGVLGRIVFDGKDVPLCYTPHGYSFLMEDQSLVKRFFYKLIEAICAKRKCTTISCSKGEHEETLRITKNATYVNNGISTREIDKIIKDISNEKGNFTVYTIGRICEQKNPVLFNEIAKKIPDIEFLWIGDGELRDELTSPNIHVTGWVERSDALRMAMKADVFLLVSRWEGLPISLLEAMYMKKLCVVSDVIGNRDVITSGENGYVCVEAEEYAMMIRNAVNTYPVNLVEKAYYDVLGIYNTEVMRKKYTEYYRSL